MSCDAAMTAMIAVIDMDKEKGMKILFDLYNEYGMEENHIPEVSEEGYKGNKL